MYLFDTDLADLLDDVEPAVVTRLYNNDMLDEEELAEAEKYFDQQVALYARDIELENEDT